MKIICLDMEGVLTPEIWLHVARRSQVRELNLTTRDVKDYRELMDRRVEVCARHGITLEAIQSWIGELDLLPGAADFIAWLRERHPFVLLSDTYYEFAGHFLKLMGYPTLLCHSIGYDAAAGRLDYRLRMDNAKGAAVRAFRSLGFRTCAAGDSYNDIHMLQEADAAAFFHAPDNVQVDFPQYANLQDYASLKDFIARS